MFMWCMFDHGDIIASFNQFSMLFFLPTLNDPGMSDPVGQLLLNCDVCLIPVHNNFI